MLLLLLLFCSLCASQGSYQQLDKKQFVNLGDSFNYGGEDSGIEDGFSRGLSDNALGGELGTENSPSSQMHITENNQGGLSLGDSINDGLGGLGALLGGNSANSFSSMNSMTSSIGGGDDFGLGDVNAGLYGKDTTSLDALGAGKDIFGGNDQITSELSSNGGKSDDTADASSLLAALGLGGKTESKGEATSDNTLDALSSLQGDKQQSLLSLLNLGKSSSSENSQSKADLGQSTSDDSLSALNLDGGNSNNNVENSVNLGDSLTAGTNTDLLGLSKNDLATLLGGSPSPSSSTSSSLANALKNAKGNDGINDGSLGILQKLLGGSTTNGDDRQGIGDFGDGPLSNELSQLDMTDDKLEKMLEDGKIGGGGGGGGGNGGGGGGGDSGETTGSDSASVDSQPAPEELPAMGYHQHAMNGMHPQMSPMLGNLMGGMGPMAGMNGGMGGMNGMGGINGMGGMGGINGMDSYGNTMGHNGMHIETGATVHAHASDKPGNSQPVSPAEASKPAKQAQKLQEQRYQEKLKKLKKRLHDLRGKLTELEDEQSKKSHNENTPAAKRKDAIKKLLIKNLKLAALIASKEIQLEEEKQSAFSAKKKETDDLGLIDIPTSHKEIKDDNDILAFSKSKAKPLTDLSKKAEDEVNHLTKSKNDKKTTEKKESSADKKGMVAGNGVMDNSTIIKQINATLAKLSEGSPQNATVSPKAYKRLVQRITQMSPKKSEAVQEAALSSLYKALMKSKKMNQEGNSKKMAINYKNVGCYKDKEKRLLTSLESSFKSPLDKNYQTRLNPLYKCARIAKLKKFPGFAIENGGQCFGGKAILKKYREYGPSLACNKNGKGGPWSLNIYKLV